MALIQDLTRCDYIPIECESLISVGWISNDFDFPKGAVPRDFYEKLKELCKSPWEPVASAGIHHCDICQFDPPSSSSNVYVPYHGQIFVAPVAIIHYIAAHRYLPPDIFIQAVMSCPDMRSMPYYKAVLQNGGRSLVHQGKACPESPAQNQK